MFSDEPIKVLVNPHDPPKSPERMNKEQGRALIKNHKKNPNPNTTKQTKKPQTTHTGILLSMKNHLSNTATSSTPQKLLFLMLQGTLKTKSRVCKMVELIKPQRCCRDIDK